MSGTNWKAPSAAHMQKYSLTPLDPEFEPTPEEDSLLEMYETVKTYERQAARLKEEAARQKLAARDAEFQQKLAPNKNKRRRNKKAATASDGAAATGNDSDSDLGSDEDLSDENDEDNEDEDDPHTLHERREAKLAALREEVEVAKQPKESEADALRAQYLAPAAEDAVDNVGPSLMRKKPKMEAEPKSLIANLNAGATPPHEFSEKMEIKRGKVLYPTSADQGRWTPPEGVMTPNDGAFLVELEDFDMATVTRGGNNTVAIKFMAPAESKRFSINIAQPSNDSFNSVLFHFNPRHHERGGQLVVNDKQEGVWGQAIAIPLSQVPLLFGQTACTLVIQINGDGFDVFLEGKHCARWEHRKELPAGSSPLILQFPSTDDYGSPENWSVYKVWWGNKEIMAKGDLSGVAGVNIYKALHPRKLFISGLSKIYSEAEVDLRRAELERAFRKYGGDRGVEVIVPTNSTYAFVEMESERQADLALTEMAGQYRMNRARRSRHEALQEERAAAEAAKQGKVKTTTDWD
jgi:hypothetical protein